jgi:hypothetical protein
MEGVAGAVRNAFSCALISLLWLISVLRSDRNVCTIDDERGW